MTVETLGLYAIRWLEAGMGGIGARYYGLPRYNTPSRLTPPSYGTTPPPPPAVWSPSGATPTAAINQECQKVSTFPQPAERGPVVAASVGPVAWESSRAVHNARHGAGGGRRPAGGAAARAYAARPCRRLARAAVRPCGGGRRGTVSGRVDVARPAGETAVKPLCVS